jgi:hypothetical protein
MGRPTTTQGPTFDPVNLWDPDETCPGDSLKDKGALKGTDLKDLCNLVVGADLSGCLVDGNHHVGGLDHRVDR